jgi:hypothetical protein
VARVALVAVCRPDDAGLRRAPDISMVEATDFRPLPGGRGRRYSLGASGQAEAGDARPGRGRESIASVSYVLATRHSDCCSGSSISFP